MVSVSCLTKRVVPVAATFHFVWYKASSLALTTRQSPPSFLFRSNCHDQPRRRVSSSISMTLAGADVNKNENSATIAKSTNDEEQLMQDMLYRIRDCNQMPDDLRSNIIDFRLDGLILGKVDPKLADILCSTSVVTTPGGTSHPVFEKVAPSQATTSPFSPIGEEYLTLSEKASGTTCESRTRAVAAVMETLREAGIVKGWRDELYPVSDSFYNPPYFLMERAATELLGVLSYGVHINGILLPERELTGDNDDDNINEKDQNPLMWMARRSKSKSKYPSMLDHIVAGGQPAGLSLMENAIKECEEEAGIPPSIARPGNLRPAGVVSYEEAKRCEIDSKDGMDFFHTISRVVLFNYDLYLPKEFVPKPVDGEVENFFLWSIDQIKESMAPDFCDPIKPNCYLVIIDYLLRMGYVSPDTNGYLDVLRELRSGDCQ